MGKRENGIVERYFMNCTVQLYNTEWGTVLVECVENGRKKKRKVDLQRMQRCEEELYVSKNDR